MKILTKEIESKLLAAAAETSNRDPVVHLKLFGLGKLGSWTWYLTSMERDEEETIFYGLVVSSMCPEGEFGPVALSEIEPFFATPRAILKGGVDRA